MAPQKSEANLFKFTLLISIDPWHISSSGYVLMPDSVAGTKEQDIPRRGSRPLRPDQETRYLPEKSPSHYQRAAPYFRIKVAHDSCYSLHLRSVPHRRGRLCCSIPSFPAVRGDSCIAGAVDPFCKSAFTMSTSGQFQEQSLFFCKGMYRGVSV